MIRELKKFYKANKRDLPWRKTQDPYKILVSEVMLQQTQVERVIPYYERWVKKFPTAKALSKAKLPEVLAMWQGLGYNRRGRYLWASAKVLSKKSSRPSLRGYPQTFSQELFAETKLPGVGPYTKAAVQAFAYNKPTVFVETNIRTVFFHHFPAKEPVSDRELLPLVADALKKSNMEPRDFYAALMDYGSHLKKQGIRLNAKSRHYTRQSAFKGSARELRGAIVRGLLKEPQTLDELTKNLSRKKGEVERELMRLAQEGLVRKGVRWRIT